MGLYRRTYSHRPILQLIEDSGVFISSKSSLFLTFPRSGTYKAFAERFAGQNLTVLTHAHVTKVLIEAGRATGVEVDRGSKS